MTVKHEVPDVALRSEPSHVRVARGSRTTTENKGRPASSVATVLKALGDSERLRLYRLFIATNAEICVCELVDALAIPQYQVSRYLKTLRDAGLLGVRRKGTWAYYSARRSERVLSATADFVAQSCAGATYERDEKRLSDRLSLRVGSQCVVGFAETRGPRREGKCDGRD